MTKTVLPEQQDVQDAVDFITNEGQLKAQEASGPMSVIQTQGNKLIIGAGTNLETHIVKNSNGAITVDSNGQQLPLQHNGAPGHSRFDALWEAIQTYLERSLYIQLHTHLGIKPQENPDPEQEHDPKLQALQSPQIATAIRETASNIRANSQPCRMTNPCKQGTQALHNFLGPRRVQKAISIAGPNATLTDFSIIHKHLKIFTQAYKQDPNATTIWFSTNRPYLWTRYFKLEPQGIIEESQRKFLNQCKEASKADSPLRLKSTNKPESLHAQNQLLDALTSLDHRAVKDRRYPPDHRQDLKSYAALCNLIVDSGQTMPPWAQKFLLDQPFYLEDNASSNLVRSFLKATPKARTRKAQEALQTQLHTIHKQAEKYRRRLEKHPHLADLSQALDPQNPVPEWRRLLKFIPTHLQPADTSPPTRIANPCTKQQIYELLNSQRGDQIRLLIDETITIHTVPGKSVALYEDHKQPPTVLFTRNPDGTISAQRHTASTWYPNIRKDPLPNPQNPSLPRYLTTQHIFANAIAHAANLHTKANWKDIGPPTRTRPPTKDQLVSYLHSALFPSPSYCTRKISTHHQLDRDIASGIATLMDQESWDIAHQITNNANPHQYNIAVTLGESLQQLNKSNPGATAWALTYEEPTDEPFHHPGQLIASTKKSLAKAGLEPRNWKFVATLDTKTINAIANHATPAQAALVLNAAAQTRSAPHPEVASTLTRILQPRFRTQGIPFPKEDQDQTFRTFNITKVISLACQESARIARQHPEHNQWEIINAIPSLNDYANQMSIDGHPIKSTKWSSLAKASEAWHRTQAIQRQTFSWNQYLSSTQGLYLAWHSALETTKIDGYTFRPLADEKQLHYEATSMNHCVHRYGPNCANGQSRIFSLSKDGKQTATTEIRKSGESWHHAQTKLKDNHQPPRELEPITLKLAEKYQNAELNQPQPEETSWNVRDQTYPSSQETGP